MSTENVNVNVTEKTTVVNATVDTSLKGRQAQLVQRIVGQCSAYEHKGTAHYIKVGALCSQFIDLWRQDGGKRSDGVNIIKGKLADAGLHSLDVSAYVKTHALYSLCNPVDCVPVSVIKAMLPLVSIKGEAPTFVDGISAQWVTDLCERIGTERLNRDKVKAIVDSMLGTGKEEKTDGDKAVDYFNKLTDAALVALWNNSAIADRLLAAFDKVEKSKASAA